MRPGDQHAVPGDIQGVEYYHLGIFISVDLLQFTENKCEHFASKYKTGLKAISKQVIDKLGECILNPLQIFKEYELASSPMSGSSGSFGSRQ